MGSNFSKGFLKLLTRYRKGQSTAEEQEAMETWYESLDDPDLDTSRNPENKEKGVLTSDRVHLTDEGNKFLAEKMMEALVKTK